MIEWNAPTITTILKCMEQHESNHGLGIKKFSGVDADCRRRWLRLRRRQHSIQLCFLSICISIIFARICENQLSQCTLQLMRMEKKEEHQRRRRRRRRNALSKRKMRKINNSNGCDSFWQTQCDTLQESCCMTIVMDNFVEWMLFFSFFPFSSSVGFFPFVICLLLVAFSSICVEQQLRIVNKTGRRKGGKKVHSSLNAIYSCNWRLLTRCLHAVDNVTVQQMCGSWLKGNCHANRSAIIFNRKCSQPTK